jgi:hypothetical protein
MSTFQKILDTTGIQRPNVASPSVPGERLVIFTNNENGTQVGSIGFYPVTGVDELGNTFSATMTRGRFGEFNISNLQQTN